MKPWQRSCGQSGRAGKTLQRQRSVGPFIEVVGNRKAGQYNDRWMKTTLFYYQSMAQTQYLCHAANPHAVPRGSPDSGGGREIRSLARGFLDDIQTIGNPGGANGFFLFRMGSRFTVCWPSWSGAGAGRRLQRHLYAASQRRHEIGVRMALGAGAVTIKMVLRQGLCWWARGCLLASIELPCGEALDIAGRPFRHLILSAHLGLHCCCRTSAWWHRTG